MFEMVEQPVDAGVGEDATMTTDDFNFDIDIDIDFNINGDAEQDVSPTVENEVSILDEDVILEYKGTEYPCNTHTLMQGSKGFSDALQDYEASQTNPQVLNVPTFSECDSPEVFYATLEVCYSGSWTRENAWELHMSYLSCTKIWLIGHHFGIDTMKQIAIAKAKSVTQELTQHFHKLPESQERQCERAHLASLIRAAKLANRHEWHAGLWKMLYDAGEAVAPKLLQNPVFQTYIKTSEGQDYARAIGATEKSNPTWEEEYKDKDRDKDRGEEKDEDEAAAAVLRNVPRVVANAGESPLDLADSRGIKRTKDDGKDREKKCQNS